ncbi:MAG: hypothetical protein ACK4M1_06440 [Flavobacterium sp.]
METIKNRIATLFGVLILVFMLVLPTDVFSQGPPPWAPAHGYRAKTRHIYFPDHNVYFDLQKKVFIYINGSSWSVGVSLPTSFGSINLRTSSQIELDYYGNYPYYFNKDHKVKYKKNKSNVSGKPKPKSVSVSGSNGKANNGKGNSGKGNSGKGNKGNGKGNGK